MAMRESYDYNHCECTQCGIILDSMPPNNPPYCNHCREDLRTSLDIPPDAKMGGVSRVFQADKKGGKDQLHQLIGVLLPCEATDESLWLPTVGCGDFINWDWMAYANRQWLPLENVKSRGEIQLLLQVYLYRFRFAETPVYIEQRVSFWSGIPEYETRIEGIHRLQTSDSFEHLRWLINEFQGGAFGRKGQRSLGSTDRSKELVQRGVDRSVVYWAA